MSTVNPNPRYWRDPNNRMIVSFEKVLFIRCTNWWVEDTSPEALAALDGDFPLDVHIQYDGGPFVFETSPTHYWALINAYETWLAAL